MSEEHPQMPGGPDWQNQGPAAAPSLGARIDQAMAWAQQNVAIAAGVAVAVVLVLGVGGYFLFAGKSGPAKSSSGATLSAEQQAAIAQGVCGVTVKLARDYGVVPMDATLGDTEAKETGKQGFVSCQAQSGGAQYAMVAQVKCDDLGNKDCLLLDSVKTAAGEDLYQHRPYSIRMFEPVAEAAPAAPEQGMDQLQDQAPQSDFTMPSETQPQN